MNLAFEANCVTSLNCTFLIFRPCTVGHAAAGFYFCHILLKKKRLIVLETLERERHSFRRWTSLLMEIKWCHDDALDAGSGAQNPDFGFLETLWTNRFKNLKFWAPHYIDHIAWPFAFTNSLNRNITLWWGFFRLLAPMCTGMAAGPVCWKNLII